MKLVMHAHLTFNTCPSTFLSLFSIYSHRHHLYHLPPPSTTTTSHFLSLTSTTNSISAMAETRDRSDRDRGDRDRDIAVRPHHQLQVHPQKGGGTLSYGRGAATGSGRGPTASQVIAVVTLVPIGGILLCLAGFTLLGSLIGLAVATPLFILFSPVLVPAIILIALAVTGFLSSGAFGLTGLSSLSWVAGYLKQASQRVPEDLDYAKKRMADVAAYAGQKTKEAGHTVESKAKETGTGTTTSTGTTGRT